MYRSLGAAIAAVVLAGSVTCGLADEADDLAGVVGGGRYMERPACSGTQTPATTQCCQIVAADSPLIASVLAPYADLRMPGEGYQGLQDCRYRANGLETRVIMLNPTPRRVAEWTISACQKASAASLAKCARWLWKNVFADSGTQFAVTGLVVEPNATHCWSGPGPQPGIVGYTFRDGVTVRLANLSGVCDGDKTRLGAEPNPYFDAAVVKSTSRGPSRVTMLTRQAYQTYFSGTLPGRDADGSGQVEWLKLVRDAHMLALRSTDHAWLDRIVSDRLPKALRQP